MESLLSRGRRREEVRVRDSKRIETEGRERRRGRERRGRELAEEAGGCVSGGGKYFLSFFFLREERGRVNVD